MNGSRRWWGLAVVALGLAMIILDGTIVGVALPTIIKELNLDLSTAQWVNSLYNVVFAALLLTFGALGDRFGRRTTFLVGLVVFVAGSLLAANAGAGGALIAARAVQGLGGALILPSTLSTVNATFQGKERAAAFGVWGAVMAGAAAVGPLLGGWLTEYHSWQWVFYINVPLGAVVFLGGVLVVANTRSETQRVGTDIPGPLLSAVAFGGLVFGIIEGPDIGWWAPIQDLPIGLWTWSTAAVVSAAPVALALGVVGLVAFVAWEHHRAQTDQSAILDLTLFAIPTFSWGNTTAAMVAVGEFSLVFVLPLLLINAMGLSTIQAGLVLFAMAFGAFLSGAMARHLADRYTPAGVVLIGLVMEVVGVVAMALLLSASASVWAVSPPLVLYGLGLGLASAQLTSTVLVDVPVAQSGQGSATQSTVRQVGSAMGAALGGLGLSTALGGGEIARLQDLGVAADQAKQLAEATASSAGSIIPAIRSGAMAQVPNPEAVAAALADGFVTATQVSLAITAAFLLLGLLGATRVARAARADPADPAGADDDTPAQSPR